MIAGSSIRILEKPLCFYYWENITWVDERFTMDTIVICAALPVEIRALCRRWGIPVPTPENRVSSIVDPLGNIIYKIIVSGMGLKRMETLLKNLSPEPITQWISVGFAGSLVPELRVGDCLWGTLVAEPSGKITSTYAGDGVEEKDKNPILFCSNRVIGVREEKQQVHSSTGATVVDLESAAVAAHARSRNEPFVWIRVISDDLEDTIPDAFLRCVDQEGFPSVSAAMVQLLFHPTILPAMIRLARRTVLLSRCLADAVTQFSSSFYQTTTNPQTPDDSV